MTVPTSDVERRIDSNREEILRCHDHATADDPPGRAYWQRQVDRYLDHERHLRTNPDEPCPCHAADRYVRPSI